MNHCQYSDQKLYYAKYPTFKPSNDCQHKTYSTFLAEEFSESQTSNAANTLGNLTILKGGKNSSVGNRSWADKQARFRTGSYNEIDISQHTMWGKTQIFNRGLDMLGFLESKVTGLVLTDTEKQKLLFYEDYLISQIVGMN